MTKPLPFHLDENVDVAVAYALRRRGVDVTLPMEVDLVGATDEAHLDFAHRRGRMVVTHDADFLRLHATGRPHGGIGFCASGTRSVGEISRALLNLHVRLSAEAMFNHVECL